MDSIPLEVIEQTAEGQNVTLRFNRRLTANERLALFKTVRERCAFFTAFRSGEHDNG